MAGERFAKLTLRASWSLDDETRGTQTLVRIRLLGVWEEFGHGSDFGQNQFHVPDPDDDADYLKNGVANLIAVIRASCARRSLSYVVSDAREAGLDSYTGLKQFDFDVTAASYDSGYDLDFDYFTNYGGWQVLLHAATIAPVLATVITTPAGSYGSAAGNIYVTPYQYQGTVSYRWADANAPTTSSREGVVAGTYYCTVTDSVGASAVFTCVVKGDARLSVLVRIDGHDVRLVPSGGRPAYSYAWLDDGAPATASRRGLDPGSYACTVTDSVGASYLVQFAIAPYRYYWSQNPVLLELDAGDKYHAGKQPSLSFLCEVWVEPDYLSGEFVRVGPSLEQPADGQGRTRFDAQALLDSYLSEHLPSLDEGPIERADCLFRRFYFKYAQKSGGVADELSTSEQHYVVLGGLSDEEALAGTWFSSYQPAVKPFLTWEARDQPVLPTQPLYLYYLHADDGGAFELWGRVFHAEGISAGKLADVDQVSRFEVFCLHVSPATLQVDAGSTGFEVWVQDAQGNFLSEVRRFELDWGYYAQQRFFLYTNSLGGTSVLAATGQGKETLETKGEVVARPSFDALRGDSQVLSLAGTPSLSVVTRPRRRADLVLLQELLLSGRVTLLSGGLYWPGYVNPASFGLRDEAEALATLSFEYVLPKRRRYSPRLPLTAAGDPVAPVAGGEGPQP